jgi:hypothetical protein
MVWGGISFNGRTQLVIVRNGSTTAARYRDDIIVPHVQPYAENFGPNFIFMHDNTRPHIAHIVTIALRDANIDSLEWRAKSPDLNPIEHLWDYINRRIRFVHVCTYLQLILKSCPTCLYKSGIKYHNSMPRKMHECIATRGGTHVISLR